MLPEIPSLCHASEVGGDIPDPTELRTLEGQPWREVAGSSFWWLQRGDCREQGDASHEVSAAWVPDARFSEDHPT